MGRGRFFGDYAATNEGEFFAVVSERFFTRPLRFRRLHPDLYAVLAEYFQVEPHKWFLPAGPEVPRTTG